VGLKRLLFLVAVAAVMSLGLASSAPAGNFDEQRMGCAGEDPGICPTGTEGVPYSIPIELLGDEDEGCAVYSVSSGSLPPGINLNSDAARISGTPTQAGSFNFYLNVSYDREATCLFKNPSQDSFRININQGLAKLTIGPESTTPGTTGTPYSLQMTATVPEAKTWSVSSGTLPPGLALDANTGLISGTPTTPGQFDFQVHAKMNSDSRTDTKFLSIVVRAPVAIAASDPFDAVRRAQSEVSVPFQAMLTASGGTGTYTWALASGTLPAGLTLADGAIAGTPTTAGVFPFAVTATDPEGRVATYAGRITVAPKLTVSTLLVRPGRVGKLYRSKLSTLGGVKPTTWRVLRGPLPRGIRLDRTTGQLSGIPKRAGVFRVTFEATDELEVVAAKTFRIVVAPAPKPKKRSR
jgi:large repetitive protein